MTNEELDRWLQDQSVLTKLKLQELIDKECEARVMKELQKAREEERERIAQGLPMKGEMGKLTPFQEIVNTYIANRLKELSGSQE